MVKTLAPTQQGAKSFRSPFYSTSNNEKKTGVILKKQQLISRSKHITEEDRQVREQIKQLKKENSSLESSLKILAKYQRELEVLELIDKWRAICQAGMSYLMNSTLIKINKMGGYDELVRREIEAEKRKLEYQFASGLQDEIDDILESDEFKLLPDSEQKSLRQDLDQRLEDQEKWQSKEMAKLDSKLKENSGKELTMEELASRLKVNYELVFGE